MRTTLRPNRSTRAAALVAALAVPALALSACGNSSSGGSTGSSSATSASSGATSSGTASTAAAPTSTAPTPAVKGDLAGVTVGGTDAKPTVKLAGNKFSVKETTIKVLKEGTGETLKNGDRARTKVLAVTGSNGAVVYDSFANGQTEHWTIGDPQTLAGISKALLGQKVGTRMLAAIPPSDGFGDQGQPQLKVTKDDTLVFLIEITGKAPDPIKEATGTPVAPKAGMPTVKFEYGKPATITVPKTAPPKTLESQLLVQGNGATVQKGQTIQVHYTGVTWADGKTFDSSFNRGTKPTEFPIGVGQVIPAWDKTLVGKKVGDRVLIVSPPGDAYGAQGQGSIAPNSTLVFVVDIVGAF